MPAAIVFAAAAVEPTERLKSRLAALREPFVVAADGGATIAAAFGLRPDVLIGDLDSLSDRPGLTIEQHPRDKDETDGQLAVTRALQEGPDELVLVGFLGGPRLDQLLANVFLMTSIDIPVVMVDEHNEATLLRGRGQHEWSTELNEVVSLIPVVGDVHGVHTSGLRWKLDGDNLRFGDTRGISNEPIADEVRVTVESGLLLVTRHFPL